MLSAAQISDLVHEFYKAELDLDLEMRLDTVDSTRADLHAKQHGVLLAELRKHLARGEFALISWAADAKIGEKGLPIERDSFEFRQLCQGLMRGWVEVAERLCERDQGHFDGAPTDPLIRADSSREIESNDRPQRARSILNSEGDQPLTPLFERLIAEKRDLRPKTVQKYRVVAKLFDEFTGGKAANAATRQDVVDFKDLLTRLPVNWTKRFPGMSLTQAIERNKTRCLPTLNPRNINDSYLVYLGTFFRWAVRNNIRTDNPAGGVAVVLSKAADKRQSRNPFSAAQLQRIFEAPIYAGCQSPGRPYLPGKHLIRDHRFWVPLIALFSGARLNELGQLEVGDLETVGAISFFRITTDSELSESENVKLLKTEASRRSVPIHPRLIELGFLQYVGDRRAAGDRRLFPDWLQGNDGTYSSVFSKSFNGQFLPKIGVKTKKLVFHSFRHNFIDAMRDAGIEDAVAKALVGHSDRSTTAIYGSGQPISRLAGAMERIRYDCLDLSHLVPNAGGHKAIEVAA
jgi:integrase